ncbi:MAG: Hsp33 family molecular chaperone HslO [Candidatus Competibacter sp.]|nr:Hsp33 family molecular chaperone HslO [Candidatus Competibacter sp.]MDG4584774.1 Hsp33 family molecular chaperone HslO [Candidatus Competibacter sp.]
MPDRDYLQRFLFENLPTRGEIVRLDATWRTVLERRAYPPAVRQVLGEAVAAAALISATIKFDGLLTLQIQARGPLRLLVVQVAADRTLRGLARWDGDPKPAPLCALCGDGALVLTLDAGSGKEPYQSVIDLRGDTLTETLEHYFAHSEQLPTRIWLATDEQTAAGLLLQQLPGNDAEPDAWRRLNVLADTLQSTELLRLDVSTLLRRLFHEELVRLFAPRSFSYRCNCSRERTAGMLRALGENELRQALAEKGALQVDCEFCGHRYVFDPLDIAGLFATTNPAHPFVHH